MKNILVSTLVIVQIILSTKTHSGDLAVTPTFENVSNNECKEVIHKGNQIDKVINIEGSTWLYFVYNDHLYKVNKMKPFEGSKVKGAYYFFCNVKYKIIDNWIY